MMVIVGSIRYSIAGSVCSGDNFSEENLVIDGYHITEGALLGKYLTYEIILNSLWILACCSWAFSTK